MPPWAWIAIVAGISLLMVAAAAVLLLLWRSYERRALLKLLVRTEGIEAAAAALTEAVSRLAVSSDEDIETFADDSESMERRTFAEVKTRSGIIADEVDRMALPKRLVSAAEAIADAAIVVGEQAALVDDEHQGVDALERLGGIDLGRVGAYIRKARALLGGACDQCGLEETAVYGGGLYL